MTVDPSDPVRRIRPWDSDTPSFDALMLLGPMVVLALVVTGRNVATTTLAVGYIVAFVVAIAHKAGDRGDGP